MNARLTASQAELERRLGQHVLQIVKRHDDACAAGEISTDEQRRRTSREIIDTIALLGLQWREVRR